MKNIILFIMLLTTFISVGLAINWHGAAIAPDGQKCWVCAIDTTLVKHSPNFCQSWQSQSIPDVRILFDIFFINAEKGWIGADQGFIFYTENSGNNWTRQVTGLGKHAARIFFIDTSFGWAACGTASVGRTSNGGTDWEHIILEYPPFQVDTVDLYGISFVDKKKGWTCAGRYPQYIESIPGQGDTWFTKGQGYIAVSNDSGFTWQLQRKDTIYDFYDIRFIDSLTGYVVGGNDRNNAGVVMKTMNGGQTWQIVTIPTQAKILRALENVGNHWWAVGRNGTIIRSTNGGNTWTMQQSNVDATLFDVDFADTLRGIIAGNGYVLYTNNGGNTWQIANVGLEEINKLFANTKKSIFQAYPNPFCYQITLQKPIEQTLQIYNVSGELVRTFDAKSSSVIWDGKDNYSRFVPRGVYFIAIRTKKNLSAIPIIYQK